jgi:hypothetical protein
MGKKIFIIEKIFEQIGEFGTHSVVLLLLVLFDASLGFY